MPARMKKPAKRQFSPEQLQAMRERMAKARARKANLREEVDRDQQTAGRDRNAVGADERDNNAGSTPALPTEPPQLSKFGIVPSCDSATQRKMFVYRLVQNDRMLIAREKDSQTDQHVFVGDSANFIPGMPLNAVPRPQEPAFWKVVGSLPQSKGRW